MFFFRRDVIREGNNAATLLPTSRGGRGDFATPEVNRWLPAASVWFPSCVSLKLHL